MLGILLVGLVAMQVEILKLGTSMGRSIERSTALQSQNDSLQAGVAALADDQRIERLASGMGMVMPPASLTSFVPANRQGQLPRALSNIHVSDPGNFAVELAAQVAAAEVQSPTTAQTPGSSQSTTATSPPGGSPGGAAGAGTATQQSTGATGTPTTGGGAGAASSTTSAGGPGTDSGTGASGPSTVAPTTSAPGGGGSSPSPGGAGLAPGAGSQSGG